MGYIYIIKNHQSPKVYIGQTTRDIEVRFKEHLTKDKNIKLSDAFDKYGRQNFWVEQLEFLEDNNKLSEREIFWIQYYNSYTNGYNMTPGGESNAAAIEAWKKPVEKRDKNTFELIQSFPSMIEAAMSIDKERATEIRKNIGKCCYKEMHEAYGYRWNYVGDTFDMVKRGEKKKKSIVMCEQDSHKPIKKFDSAKEASRFLNKINGGHITACCKGKAKSAYGYFWKYTEEEE